MIRSILLQFFTGNMFTKLLKFSKHKVEFHLFYFRRLGVLMLFFFELRSFLTEMNFGSTEKRGYNQQSCAVEKA